MLIDEKITLKIASLAKLELTDQEIKEYTKDLTNILKWMEDLKRIDVKDLQPLRNVIDIELLEREDTELAKNIEQEKLLNNAPKRNGNFFTVPKVIE